MKEYTKSGNIHASRLKRNDLVRLIEIVKETFLISDRKGDFEVSTHLPNISITENSIEDFLKHEELPHKLSRLSIRIIGWSETSEIHKSIYITLYDNYITLDVHGVDQTWVLGKYSQITNFFKEKRPWFWALHKPFAFTTGIVLVLFSSLLIDFIKAKEITYSISTTLFLIAWIFVTVFYYRGTLLPYTQIILTSKESHFTKENIIIIIALLTLIVSVIGGVIIPLVK